MRLSLRRSQQVVAVVFASCDSLAGDYMPQTTTTVLSGSECSRLTCEFVSFVPQPALRRHWPVQQIECPGEPGTSRSPRLPVTVL